MSEGPAMLASLVLAAVLPVTAAPLAGLHYPVGTWNCTYRAGATSMAYGATYAYDRDGHTLRAHRSSTLHHGDRLGDGVRFEPFDASL